MKHYDVGGVNEEEMRALHDALITYLAVLEQYPDTDWRIHMYVTTRDLRRRLVDIAGQDLTEGSSE